MSDEDWNSLRFEVGHYFTPSTPIGVAELFSGRRDQLLRLLDAVSERGRHAIVYGEPGVGKTSIAKVLQYLVPVDTSRVRYIRKAAFSSDTYSSIWLNIFREMQFTVSDGGVERAYSVADIYKDGVQPADVVRELSFFSENDIPIIVIDEFNLVNDSDTSRLMAETVKAVSDGGLKATIIVVGISDNVQDLVSGHESILRCSEQVLMPRMSNDEMVDLIESRIRKLGVTIEGNAKWKIVNLSKGLPSFGHSLGKSSTVSAINQKMLTITESHVDVAIDELLNSSQHTLKAEYELATHSNQDRARYRQILTACALAQTDETGYFIPKQVQAPLTAILGRPIGIDGFNDNLKDFIQPKRGSVLQRVGSARIYRYRFKNPAMQPYVIMKGIKDGFLTDAAKLALSSPEQGDLFSGAH